MRNLSFPSGIGEVSYPNRLCFSREAHTYIKVTTISGASNVEIDITVTYGSQSIEVSRKTNNSGYVVLPLTSILDAFADQENAQVIKNVKVDILYVNESLSLTLDCVVIGVSDREIELIRDQDTPNNLPAARKIVFPLGASVDNSMRLNIFIPELDGILVRAFNSNSGTLKFVFNAPFLQIYPESLNASDTEIIIHVFAGGTKAKIIHIPIEVDPCTEGTILHWVDKHGFPYLYRWSVETVHDEESVEDTYTHLDSNLQPFDIENKTLSKVYTLHSRIVERNLFDLCKSIIGASDIKMFNKESNRWERCYLTDSDVSDGGSPMGDLVVEISKYEYL